MDSENIFVQQRKDDKVSKNKAKNFTKSLADFYLNNQKDFELSNKSVSVNQAAVVSVPASSKSVSSFKRCLVTKALKSGLVEVLCVDDGSVMKVQSSSVFKLAAEFSKQPPVAVKCRLADVDVSGDRATSERIKELLNLFISSKYKLRVEITCTIEKDPFAIHFVYLRFEKDVKLINFNAVIAGLRLATPDTHYLMDDIVMSRTKEKFVEIDMRSLAIDNPGKIWMMLKNRRSGESLI